MRFGERTRSGTRTATWVQRPTAGVGYGVATGGIGSAQSTGTLADGFTYNYLTFTSTGTLTVTKAGFFDCLLFGGGGSGGGGKSADGNTGGGGGGGGILQTTVYLSADTTVTIGAGGVHGAVRSTNGANSRVGTTVGSLVIMGGGGGQGWFVAGGDSVASELDSVRIESRGGSAGGQNSSTTYGQSTSFASGIMGNNGGTRDGLGCGGGGGAGAVGANAPSTGVGGNGGAGHDVSAFIGGSALFKAAGGGGAGSVSAGSGGSSIGGNGSTSGAGTAASANTASGGGGSRNDNNGGSGGSGIVYVRFRV